MAFLTVKSVGGPVSLWDPALRLAFSKSVYGNIMSYGGIVIGKLLRIPSCVRFTQTSYLFMI